MVALSSTIETQQEDQVTFLNHNFEDLAPTIQKHTDHCISHDKKSLSRFLVAIMLFAGLSVLCALAKTGIESPIDFRYHSWSAWAIEDFFSLNHVRPQLVFMGSSLMLVPLGGVDAQHLNKQVDASQHHKSCYFEERLRQNLGFIVPTFNFALPGEMPSDAYLITRFLLKEDKRPDAIVYGVGPRDFMDSLLPSPEATDPYQWLSRFGDTKDVITRLVPAFWPSINYQCGQICYLYGRKNDLCMSAERLHQQMVSGLLPTPESTFDIWSRRSILPDYRPLEIVKGECWFRPVSYTPKANFDDNLEEYRRRYSGNLNWETFLGQLNFFSDTISLARKRGIRVIVMAMPITEVNRKLLGDFKWNLYRQNIKVVAKAKGATFIDFENSGHFSNDDFMDTVHLNPAGGKKLLDLLAYDVARVVKSTGDLHL